MTVPERLYGWNRWYDQLPQEWRFQVVLWPIIAAGFLNMLLTLGIRCPFGLLVLVAVLCVAAIRFPYVAGWIAPAAADPSGEPDASRFEIPGADWLIDLNQRYDAMPDARRFWVFPAVLLIAGAINMALTIGTGFSFGLLFLLALLALVAIRAPYVAGMLKSPSTLATPVLGEQGSPRIAHDPSPMISAEPRSVEPATISVRSPPDTQREGETGDVSERIAPSVDMKAAPPAESHDSMAMTPPPAPPVTRSEMQAPAAGEPAEPSDDVKASSWAKFEDSVAVAPPAANEVPPASAVMPEEEHAANVQPTPPRNRSRKADPAP